MRMPGVYCRAMAIMEATLGWDHPQDSIQMKDLALLLEKQVRAEVWVVSPVLALKRWIYWPIPGVAMPERLRGRANRTTRSTSSVGLPSVDGDRGGNLRQGSSPILHRSEQSGWVARVFKSNQLPWLCAPRSRSCFYLASDAGQT